MIEYIGWAFFSITTKGNPVRIAYFTDTFLPKVDGIVTVIQLLLDHLAARGVESIIVAPKLGKPQDRPAIYANTRVIGVDGFTLPLYPEMKVCFPGRAVYRELQNFQPDLIHLISPVFIGGIGLRMAKRLAVPTVASFHLDFAGIARHFKVAGVSLAFMGGFADWATRVMFNSADHSLAPSEHILSYMQRIGVREVSLWRRGVDADRFHPRFRDHQTRLMLSNGHPDDLLLLYVGRLSREKQIDTLRAVLDAVPGTRLAIVGDGPARAELEQHFAGYPVHFTGYLGGEALSRAFASADCFVLNSALESFGLVVLEAFASGLPVVAARVGGVPDVVREGVTGCTFAAGDVDGLVEAVRCIVARRGELAQMGAAARADAEALSWPAMMDEVLALYARLIAQKKQK